MSALAAPMARPAGDRVILGVCAAIADRTGVDTTIVRVIAAIGAAVLTTPFVVAYAALALVVPRDDGRHLLGGDPPDRRETLIGWTLVVAAGLLVIATPSIFGLGDDVSLLEAGVIAIAIGLLAVVLGGTDSSKRGESAPTTVQATTEGEALTTELTTESETHELRPTPAAKPDRGPSIFLPAFGVITAALGIGAIVIAVGDVELSAMAVAVGAGAVAVACGGLAVAAHGRRGAAPLLILGILLALVAAAAALTENEWDRGVGEQLVRPVDAAEARAGYEWGMGYLEVDARDLELPAGRTVMPVEIGFGAAKVIVPRDLEIISIGESISVPERSGDVGRKDPVLVIDGDARIGSIEIERGGR